MKNKKKTKKTITWEILPVFIHQICVAPKYVQNVIVICQIHDRFHATYMYMYVQM